MTLDGAQQPLFEQSPSRFTLKHLDWGVRFDGHLYDGRALSYHEESAREGYCRLMTYESSSCDPPCDPGEGCIAGTCQPHPSPLGAGTLTLGGLSGGNVQVEPVGEGKFFWESEDVAASPQVPVSIALEGVDTGTIELETCVTDPPDPSSDWSRAMADRGDGEDVILRWSNSIDTGRIYLWMTTCVGTHGGIAHAEIECEGPDTGELILPGGFLDLLFSEGWGHGECGNFDLMRYHASEVEAGGHVIQLRTQSPAWFYFHP